MDGTKEYSFVLSTMPRLHARTRLLEYGVYVWVVSYQPCISVLSLQKNLQVFKLCVAEKKYINVHLETEVLSYLQNY